MLFLSILFIEFIIVPCSSITKEGYYFPALVKTTLVDVDWAGCLIACHKNLECISYNYNREEKICELNVDGIRDHCAGPSSPIITSKDWIFHQTRVSKICFKGSLRLSTNNNVYHLRCVL